MGDGCADSEMDDRYVVITDQSLQIVEIMRPRVSDGKGSSYPCLFI